MVSFVLRRTGLILWLSAIATVVGGYYTARLYGSMRTDLEELLPRSARSVIDLDSVARRLRSIDNLAILVFSSDTKASKRFVQDLAALIEKAPKDEVVSVSYRIDRELEFFRKRQALYLETKDLARIHAYLAQRIQYEKELHNPFTFLLNRDLPEPELDFEELRRRYEGRDREYARFPDGYFATPDETKRVILVDVPAKALGAHGVRVFRDRVEKWAAGLNPASYAPDLTVHYSGSVQEMIEEQDALVQDLGVSSVMVTALVGILMLAYFRTLRTSIALLVSLLGGTVWTFGVTYFVVGYLNANSAFLGSIVMGNGINFGIILLARYLEERRRGRMPLRALRVAVGATSLATLTAALAAGLAYGSLATTSFRGFSQFGVIGLMGMVICWVATFTTFPALILALEGKRGRVSRPPVRRALVADAVAASVVRWPRAIALVSVAATAAAGFAISRADYSSLIETNLTNLRSRESEETGAAFYNNYINQIFQRFLTPLVVLPSSRENALAIARELKDRKKEQGPASPIVSVQTIDDFVPSDQPRKIALLRKIQGLLPPRILAAMDDADRQKVHRLLSPEAFKRLRMNDLPQMIRDKFTEQDGSLGKLVLIEPPLSKDIWNGDNLARFIEGIRSAADSVEPGAPVAGGMAISSDLVASILKDGPRATMVAIVAVVLLVIVLFREIKSISYALLSLGIGVTWLGGLIVLLSEHGLKINFLNFVALPITFGIGIDYGVNVFQRYRGERGGGIAQVIRETGGAVGLCSLTTIIGYSSLLIASNRGFVSFGLLAVMGELTCAFAALFALPSLLLTFSPRIGPRARRREGLQAPPVDPRPALPPTNSL